MYVISEGRAVYTFEVPVDGEYVVTALVDAPSIAANSFFLNVDAEPTNSIVWDIVDLTSGFEDRNVSWRGSGTPISQEFNPKVFELSAGEHELIIIGREANAKLDRITFTAYSEEPEPPQENELQVKQDGTGDFTTIQECANSVSAGKTCVVHSGTYNERVTVNANGTASQKITFRAEPARSVTMNGFKLFGDYVKIEGFRITNPATTGGIPVRVCIIKAIISFFLPFKVST